MTHFLVSQLRAESIIRDSVVFNLGGVLQSGVDGAAQHLVIEL